MRGFTDKVVVITGAASGIGLATATALLEAGAKVHLVDIDVAVSKKAEELGDRAMAHLADVRLIEQFEKLADDVIEADGRVDVLINNAGICVARAVEELNLDDWGRSLDVNLWGVINSIHAFLPHMLQQGQGHIVNISSMAGLLAFPMVAPYCASKFAVVGLSESLSAELSPRNIKVTVVCPGAVRTELLERARIDMTGERSGLLVSAFEKLITSPEKQAREILEAIRDQKTIQFSPGLMLPLHLMQKVSREFYNKAWSLAVRLINPKNS